MKFIKVAITFLLVSFIAGCATGAKVQSMTVNTSDAIQVTHNPALKNEVSIDQVGGGDTTLPFWTSEISGEDFMSALESSLRSYGLYSNTGKYKLSANLVNVDQPFGGFNMTVTTHVTYTLIDSSNGNTLFKETIITPYTAKLGDHILGFERLRLANEGSGKENIKALIKKFADIHIMNVGGVSLN